jgi:tRNA dimethylallyltransferase
MEDKPRLVVIAGPTGTGKSDLALEVAQSFGGEIINADSLAFYRGLDIGTAKPSQDDQARVTHHLIDILDPCEDFSAADYVRLARPLIGDLWARGKLPLVVGGTGLYLRSLMGGLFEGPGRDQAYRKELKGLAAMGVDLHELLKKLDPVSAARIRPSDPVRTIRALEVLRLTGEGIASHQDRHALSDRPFETLMIVIDRPLEEMDERLRLRTRLMFERGLIGEVRRLLDLGYPPELKPFQSVGYRECLDVLEGKLDPEKAHELVFIRTRQLAKRQRTWFRGQAPGASWLYPELEPVKRLIGGFFESGQYTPKNGPQNQ